MQWRHSSHKAFFPRCMIRDVAVKVPEPEDFITEAIFPSHIVVPRCSGNKKK